MQVGQKKIPALFAWMGDLGRINNEQKFNSKRKDFETFCLLMEMIMNKDHRSKPGLRKMLALKQTMH